MRIRRENDMADADIEFIANVSAFQIYNAG